MGPLKRLWGLGPARDLAGRAQFKPVEKGHLENGMRQTKKDRYIYIYIYIYAGVCLVLGECWATLQKQMSNKVHLLLSLFPSFSRPVQTWHAADRHHCTKPHAATARYPETVSSLRLPLPDLLCSVVEFVAPEVLVWPSAEYAEWWVAPRCSFLRDKGSVRYQGSGGLHLQRPFGWVHHSRCGDWRIRRGLEWEGWVAGMYRREAQMPGCNPSSTLWPFESACIEHSCPFWGFGGPVQGAFWGWELPIAHARTARTSEVVSLWTLATCGLPLSGFCLAFLNATVTGWMFKAYWLGLRLDCCVLLCVAMVKGRQISATKKYKTTEHLGRLVLSMDFRPTNQNLICRFGTVKNWKGKLETIESRWDYSETLW